MFLITINKSVPEMSITLLTGGAAALSALIGLPPMLIYRVRNLIYNKNNYKIQSIVRNYNIQCKKIYYTM